MEWASFNSERGEEESSTGGHMLSSAIDVSGNVSGKMQ
jgi:hypothetical protein